GEHRALVRDLGRQDEVVRRDAVARHDQDLVVADRVHLAHLAGGEVPVRETGERVECHVSLTSASCQPHVRAATPSKTAPSRSPARSGRPTASSRASSIVSPPSAACLRRVSRNGTPDSHVAMAAACTSAYASSRESPCSTSSSSTTDV